MKEYSLFHHLMSKLMILTICLLSSICSFAVPAKPGFNKFLTLTDGTTINATLVGDEFAHYWVDAEGYAYQAVSEDVYKRIDLQAVKAHGAARRSVANQQRKRRLTPRKIGEVGSLIGKKKGLIILVNFSDAAFKTANNNALYQRIANEKNFSYGNFRGSMYDYFYDQSEGQFELTFDVIGPVTVSNSQSYYGENDDEGYDKHPAEMVVEAVKLVDSQVNYANYDWDGDGLVDQVYVVYAGKGEADGGAASTIWPHEYNLYSANYYGDGAGPQYLDGVWINTYACGGELNGRSGDIAGIGTMCHEFSHCLGFPDFYDTDYSGGQGMFMWDLMDSGSYNGDGYCPSGYTSYERWMAGWKEPIELVNSQNISNMTALQNYGSSTYIIYNQGNRNEYFLFENRQKTKWDTNLPGAGLLILHVDYDADVWSSNKANDDPNHQRLTWVPADNQYQFYTYNGRKDYTEEGAASDPFPYGSVNALGKNTTPAAKLYNKNSDGTYYLDSSVENIVQNSNGTISFYFKSGANTSPAITFADSNVKAICVANWDTNGDGELSEAEAAEVTDLGDVFVRKSITSFNELQYFTGLTSIDDGAFFYCSDLTSVTIGNSVKSIGTRAFCGCKSLTSIFISSNLTSIGESTFFGCSGLTTITIPNSVTNIGSGAFNGCTGLTSITIPNSVTSIGYRTFMGCSGLTSITIPNSVTSIGEDAFSGCINLPSITIPNNVTSIGIRTFHYCSSLTSVTIGNSVTSIGESAFERCSSLTSITIPNSVTSIGEGAFSGCINLLSITIPNSVMSIGIGVFEECSGLTLVKVEAGNTTYDSRNNCNAIIETATNTLITGCKNTLIPNNVTSIGKAAFSGHGLTSITIPNSVTNIGSGAFSDCTGLTSITIPNSVTSIGGSAFSGCSNLNSVISKIQEPFEYGKDAFEDISSTCVLTVPIGTRNAYIIKGWGAFMDIVEEEDSSPAINFSDANVKKICVDNWDTNHDGELSETEAADINDLGTVFNNKIQIRSFDELQFFMGLTSIGEGAFVGCSDLTSITIPESVTRIGAVAFANCSGLKSISIPNSVTSIGMSAFFGCSGLTSITIPKSVTNIDIYAFSGCSGLTSIIVEDGNTNYNSFNNCNAIIETATNTLIAGCQNSDIPNSVTSIGDGAFAYCSNLTYVTIDNSLTSIGSSAFYGCSGLISVTIPNSVTSIGVSAFCWCSSLIDVYCYAENIPNIDNSAFDNSPISSATLHVPEVSLEAYKTTSPWSEFGTIVAIEEVDQSNTIACADIMARTGQQVELPIMLTNEADLTIVGISFTLTLPEGVTIATDDDDDPLYSLVSTRLNTKHFNVYSNQYANGSWGFRVITNNTTAALIGTEGEFMTLILDIADNMAEGDYSISLTDNRLSVRNSDNIVSKPLGNSTSTLTINNVIMGDVNGDGEVDLSDAIMVTYYSLNVVLPSFITAAADMNNDGEVDLSDAIIIIYKSLGVQFGNNAKRPNRVAICDNDYLQLSGEGGNFGMSLSNEGSYVGFQCDIKLPAGSTLTSVSLNDSRAAGHTLMFNQIDDGIYRVAAFSSKGEAFLGNLGDLLLFTADGIVQGEVSVENIFFVDTDLRKRMFDALSAIATGIQSATANMDEPVYDLWGRRVDGKQSLHKGIYISKNKKTARK